MSYILKWYTEEGPGAKQPLAPLPELGPAPQPQPWREDSQALWQGAARDTCKWKNAQMMSRTMRAAKFNEDIYLY